jgi:alpha-beta hydrolase superfamily lysophospholipase
MLKSHDGKVFYREWTCVDPKAVIIFVHGLGGYSGRFFEMGAYFAKSGFQIFAIEQKGHGESPSIKGHISNFKVYTQDLRSLVEFAKNKYPGKKLFIFGESMGGLVTLDFSIHYQSLIDGIILISPAIKEKMGMPLSRKADIFYSALFKPLKYFDSNFDAGVFTRDNVMAKRINADPLELRKFTAQFYFSILKAMIFVGLHPKKLKLPALMLVAGIDNMVSADAAVDYFKKMSSSDKTLKVYPEMFHALYVDKDREKVFTDIIEWVKQRC